MPLLAYCRAEDVYRLREEKRRVCQELSEFKVQMSQQEERVLMLQARVVFGCGEVRPAKCLCDCVVDALVGMPRLCL